MSPEQLMALIEQMGLAAKEAETSGGGAGGWYDVTTAIDESKIAIVDAIVNSKGIFPAGTTREQQIQLDRETNQEQLNRRIAQSNELGLFAPVSRQPAKPITTDTGATIYRSPANAN